MKNEVTREQVEKWLALCERTRNSKGGTLTFTDGTEQDGNAMLKFFFMAQKHWPATLLALIEAWNTTNTYREKMETNKAEAMAARQILCPVGSPSAVHDTPLEDAEMYETARAANESEK